MFAHKDPREIDPIVTRRVSYDESYWNLWIIWACCFNCLLNSFILKNFLMIVFIYGCAGSWRCKGFCLVAASRGCSPAEGRRLLTLGAPLVMEHALRARRPQLRLPPLEQWPMVMIHRLSCSATWGLPSPGMLYHWAARKALRHVFVFFFFNYFSIYFY